MTIVVKALNLYVAPFLVGACMAGVTVVGDIPNLTFQ